MLAQDEPIAPMVIALSAPDAATISRDGTAKALVAADSLDLGHRVTLSDAQALMVHSQTGRVTLLVLGPAEFSATVTADGVDIVLQSGRIQASARKPGSSQPVRLLVPGATDDVDLVSAPFGDGTSFIVRHGDLTQFGYEGPSASIPLTVRGEETSLPSGGRITIRGDTSESGPLDPWRKESGFDRPGLGTELAFALAREQRSDVAEKLLANVIEWDVFASSEQVKATISAERERPETRTITSVTTTQTPTVSSTSAGASRLVGPNATANQVPPLSPAAIAVGGITAVSNLNSRAADLLNRTQARGLGFRGLSLLAVPSTTPTGTRTIGPAGLGGRP
jgi:hypothetical protein